MTKTKSYRQGKSHRHADNKHGDHKHSDQKPERGWLLTLAIILVGLTGLIGLGTILAENNFNTDNLPAWFIAAAAGAAIADIVAAIGLWAWKRWAYYLFLGSTLAAIALGLIATGSLLYAFSHIIPFAIVGYIIMPKWKYFD